MLVNVVPVAGPRGGASSIGWSTAEEGAPTVPLEELANAEAVAAVLGGTSDIVSSAVDGGTATAPLLVDEMS